jgi:hypothetical protein
MIPTSHGSALHARSRIEIRDAYCSRYGLNM